MGSSALWLWVGFGNELPWEEIKGRAEESEGALFTALALHTGLLQASSISS